MRNFSLGRRHLVNAYEVEAGIGVIAGNTVWSMPERLECEVLQKARYINTLTFTFTWCYNCLDIFCILAYYNYDSTTYTNIFFQFVAFLSETMSVMLPYILFCAYASAAHAASEALTVLPCPSRLLYVPCHMYFLCFARILNGFRWNSREEIITTNRLNVYIVGELEQEWGSRIREKNANRRQWVLQRCQRGADS